MAAINLFQIDLDKPWILINQITRDTVMKKAPPSQLPPFWKGREAPIIFLLSGVPEQGCLEQAEENNVYDSSG